MSDSQPWLLSAKQPRSLTNEKVLCQQIQESLMIQFDKMPVLNKENIQAVHDVLRKCLTAGKDIIINLKGVNKIDVQCLALLLHVHNKLSKNQGELIITNPSKTLQKIFSVTELDQIISINNHNNLNTQSTKKIKDYRFTQTQYLDSQKRDNRRK